ILRWLHDRSAGRDLVRPVGVGASGRDGGVGVVHSGGVMSRRIIVATLCVLLARADAFAQSSTLGELEQRLEEMRSQIAAIQNRIEELKAAAGIAEKNATTETPAAIQGFQDFHYRGLSLTPGGFLEGTTLFRARNENADIASSFSTLPLNGSSNAQLSEF